MSEDSRILQCELCFRYFSGGVVVALSFGDSLAAAKAGRLTPCQCGLADCAAVVAAREQENATLVTAVVRRPRVLTRTTHPSDRKAGNGCRPRVPAGQVHRGCPQDVEDAYADEQFTCAPKTPSPLPTGAPSELGLRAKDFSEEDFQRSGAARTQNAALIKHFDKPEHFGVWFSIEFLFHLGAGHHMNNRARDLRAHYGPKGWDLDNGMQQVTAGGPMLSHYRLCRIEDSTRFKTEHERHAKLVEYGLREPEQREF